MTRLGAFLRETSIDELPTLLNVLRGDMSIVGPRPLLMSYVARYNAHQARRLQAMPGITGWAQVHGRNALAWDEKFELDAWYVENQTFILDLWILGKTIGTVFRRSGVNKPGHPSMPEFRGSSEEPEGPRRSQQ
jgi:lipopolysaccharide/colanic/teichoic acid biosynthesis glycosyltransferase